MAMDLTSSILSLNAAQTQSQISIAVAKKTLDVQREQGQAVVALLQGAVQAQQQVANIAPGSLDVSA
jgi:hypothetical protein